MSAMYPSGLQALLEAFFLGNQPAEEISVCVVAVNDTYGFNVGHSTLTNLEGHTLGDRLPLTGISFDDGVFYADPLIITGLAPGLTINAIVIVATWASGSQLLAYLDHESLPSLPVPIRAGIAHFTPSTDGLFRI